MNPDRLPRDATMAEAATFVTPIAKRGDGPFGVIWAQSPFDPETDPVLHDGVIHRFQSLLSRGYVDEMTEQEKAVARLQRADIEPLLASSFARTVDSHLQAGVFNELLHPRGPGGRFGSKGLRHKALDAMDESGGGSAAPRLSLHGAGRDGMKQIFGDGEIGVPPFPNALPLKGFKGGKYYDQRAIEQFSELEPERVDPSSLSTFQANVTRGGVEHYLSDHYHQTGDTFADHGSASNRYPIVYEGYNREGKRYRTILSGNHRATAALLEGKPLMARVVRGSTTYPGGVVIPHPHQKS